MPCSTRVSQLACAALWTLLTLAQWAHASSLPRSHTAAPASLSDDTNALSDAYNELYGIEDLEGVTTLTLPSADTLVSYGSDDLDAASVHAASADPPAHDHSRRSWCKFRRGGYLYDLCPLLFPEFANHTHEGSKEDSDDKPQPKLKPMVKWVEVKKETPPTVTHTHYHISFRGKLDMSSPAWKGKQCPEGTWVCGIVLNFFKDKPKDTPRLLQIVPVAGSLPLADNHTRAAHPGLNATLRLGPKQKTAPHQELLINLHGGSYAGKNQSATIRFQCNPSAEEPSNPTFSWSWNGYHVFSWASKHGCATAVNAPNNPEPNPNPQPDPKPDTPDPTPETPPDDIPAESGGGGKDGYGEGNGEQGDEFLLPEEGVGAPSRRWWTTGLATVAWILTLSLCTFYVLYALFPRLRYLIHTYIPLPPSIASLLQSIPSPSFSSLSSKLPALSHKMPAIPALLGGKKSSRRRGSFRPGERRLRSWAQEEGVLFSSGGYETVPADDVDLGDYGEEDVMINGSSSEESSLERAAAIDRGRKPRNYGSVGGS